MYFWQGTEVATRYYASILMGHASAADLIKHIDTAVVKLSKNRIVQIGMDGPDVNWKLFEDLQTQLLSDTGKQMLNVGLCGLHTIHGLYRDGIKNQVGHRMFLAAASTYLKTHLRDEKILPVTSFSTFPLKFVPHRWVENVPAIVRVSEVLPALRQYKQATDDKKVKKTQTQSPTSMWQMVVQTPVMMFSLRLQKLHENHTSQ